MNKQLKRFKFVVMDADGTIFDSLSTYTEVFVMITSRFGVPEKSAEDYYKKTQGKSITKQFEEVIKQNVAGTQAIESIGINLLVDEFFRKVKNTPARVFGDVKEFLNWCQVNKKICFMTSGSNTNILTDRLKENGFLGVF